VTTLRHLKEVLEVDFQITIYGFAFDGDSCFNETHQNFHRTWPPRLCDALPAIPEIDTHPVIISGPLHRLKRIRYRCVGRTFSMGFGNKQLFLSTKKIEEAVFLSPVVILRAQATKRHGSTPRDRVLVLIFLLAPLGE
jgi:hypothetical protein